MDINEALIFIATNPSHVLYSEYMNGNDAFLNPEFFLNYEFCNFLFKKLQKEKYSKIDCTNTPIITAILQRDLNKEFVRMYFGSDTQPRYYMLSGKKGEKWESIN